MSFYGNISNDNKTNLTFDRIYPNRKTMDENVEKDGVFVGRFVLVEYDDNTYTRRLGYKNPNEPYNKLYLDSEYKLPYFLSEDTKEGYGLQAGDYVYVIEDGLYTYYRATGESYQADNSAVFQSITHSNGDPGDYVFNYNIDSSAYMGKFTNGWDSTVWQKSIIDGKQKYRMIATLNSIIPRFGVVAEAPSEDPIAPHFGYENTNVEYILHMPTNWGFRIKEAEDKEFSDKNEKIEVFDEETGQIIEKTKYYDIYYNKNGFDRDNRTYIEKEKDYIELLPTGESGDIYIVHENGETKLKTSKDIQEFSLHLPSIGNMASDFWDLMYGEERNTEISWDNTDGIRLITKDESTGNYNFDKEKIKTVAGIINSTQDLMGRIVRQGGNLEDADFNHIYYRIPKEEDNFRAGFFIKTLSNELISFDELNEKYGLIFEDYKEYIAGKNPQYLTQYEPNKYYIAVESGTEGKNNYLCEIGEKPTTDTKYYLLNDEDIEYVELMQWEPTPDEEIEELPEEEIIAYYYREEDGTNIQNGSPYYKYIKDTNELPDLNKEYYNVIATQLTSFEFYNPGQYVAADGKSHKFDENTQSYTGLFYYNDDTQTLVPVYNDLFIEGEQYYLLNNYTFDTETDENGKSVTVYKLNGESLNPLDLIDNEIYVKTFIDFDTQEIYSLNEDKTIFSRVKYVSDIDEKNSYTLVATLINGYLEPDPEEEETEEEIYTNFYLPETFYYKTSNNDYLLDRNDKMTKDRKYYRFNKYPDSIELTFYEPNKYYYYSKSREAAGKEPDKLDDSLVMRTADDPDVVVQQLDGREDFIYYLKRQSYVVEDSSNHLRVGQVWNVNTNEIPEGVKLGALFNDVVDELKANGHNVEKKYEWKELKGYSEDFNTINGLILQLNKLYRFDDGLTRDITTIQGTLNTLRDYFAKFDILTPGYLLAVNAYGQLDSQNPGELTLANYEVAEGPAAITEEDTLNSAFGKLEYKLNVLNGNASVEGSVANQIAEIVEVDGGAVDKLKEIANWIVDDETGAAKIIADVAKNAKNIADNKTEYDANKILTDAAIEANTNLINSNKEAIENNTTDILTLLGLVGEKSVEEQINDAITAENLSQYALSEDLNKIDERLILVEDKVESWDKAEENVQADWAEETETADSFIKNKPDLSIYAKTADLDDMVKTTTQFEYNYNEILTMMTINDLLSYIATLEARIEALENPVIEEENPEEQPTE